MKNSTKVVKKGWLLILLLTILQQPVAGQLQKGKGYPKKAYESDLLQHFAAPPGGYGNVPFYWWNGDSLRKERLQEQLDIRLLADSSSWQGYFFMGRLHRCSQSLLRRVLYPAQFCSIYRT